MLIDRYKLINLPEFADPSSMKISSIKNSLYKVIDKWQDEYGHLDFDDDTECSSYPTLDKLISFTSSYFNSNNELLRTLSNLKTDLIKRCRKKIADSMLKPDENATHFELTPNPSVPVNQLQAEQLLQLPIDVASTQLTRLDATLFCKLQPHQCLGGVWSRRSQLAEKDTFSVKATIDQFNKVVHAVTGTVLCPSLKLSQRIKIVNKWIDIAMELSKKRNLSSLKAIIWGLQVQDVHRLKKVWQSIPVAQQTMLRDLTEMYNDIQSITKLMDEDNTRIQIGPHNTTEYVWLTKKFDLNELLPRINGLPPKTSSNGSNNSGNWRWGKNKTGSNESSESLQNPIIPYLGAFLSDLTMLDTAHSDFTEDLINFEKRRKEFEVIALLKQLQIHAAKLQMIPEQEEFIKWLDSIEKLEGQQRLDLSHAIEPPNTDDRINNPRSATSWKLKIDSNFRENFLISFRTGLFSKELYQV